MLPRRQSTTITFLLLVVSLAACRSETKGMPKEYGKVRRGEDGACPSVAGRYFDSSDPLTTMLAKRPIRDLPAEGDIAYFELAGNPNSRLEVVLTYRDSTERRGVLQRGEGPWSGDYYCDDGWLKIGDRYFPTTWDATLIADDGFHARRHALWIAPNRGRDLVGRMSFVDYDEVSVWCGDGCRGFPIPWTIRRKTAWQRAEAFDASKPTPDVRARERERADREAALEVAKRDPVYQENQLLENGPPDPELDAVKRRCLLALNDGVLLRAVSRRDSGYHLSVEFEELHQLEQYMERLSGTGALAEIKVAPLYRGKMTNGHWADVVYLRYQR